MTCQLLLAPRCHTDRCPDHACQPCLDHLAGVVRDTLALWPAVRLILTRAERVDPPTGHQPPGPRIPVNAHAVDVDRDARARLVPWCREHAQRTGTWPVADTVPAMLAHLAAVLPAFRHDDTIAWLSADLHVIRDSIRTLTDLDTPHRIDVGPCPVQHAETAEWCTGHVIAYAPRERSGQPMVAACRECGSEWTSVEFSGLSRVIQRRRADVARQRQMQARWQPW